MSLPLLISTKITPRTPVIKADFSSNDYFTLKFIRVKISLAIHIKLKPTDYSGLGDVLEVPEAKAPFCST